MFKRNTLSLGGAALCGTLLVSGCANQMSQRSEHEERIERKLLEHSLQIDVGEPKVLELPQRRVRIHEQKTFEVTEFEVTRNYDRYTPYQPWREVYEILMGNGLVRVWLTNPLCAPYRTLDGGRIACCVVTWGGNREDDLRVRRIVIRPKAEGIRASCCQPFYINFRHEPVMRCSRSDSDIKNVSSRH